MLPNALENNMTTSRYDDNCNRKYRTEMLLMCSRNVTFNTKYTLIIVTKNKVRFGCQNIYIFFVKELFHDIQEKMKKAHIKQSSRKIINEQRHAICASIRNT